MKKSRFITGLPKVLFYARMSLGCAWRFRSEIRRLGLAGYSGMLMRASKFTRIFFRHKLLRLPSGEYKLDFYMPRYPSEAFFTAMSDKLLCRPPRPVSVVFSMTKACSFHCPHCYQGLDDSKEMPLERMTEVVRELRDFGVTAWAVEGGEPLLRFERLETVLREIQGLEVWVNSTGFSATPEKVRRLTELRVTGVMSSIHSVDPAEHDAFTGVPGSWCASLQFLADCKAAGMLTGFNTVLTDDRILAGGIGEIMHLAKEHDCDYVQLIHPKACGRWKNENFDTVRHEEAVRLACEAQVRYNSSKERHAPILTAQVFEESPEMLGCCCGGIDRFYIGCAGDVQPCEFVNLSFGNLNEVSFETAYSRMRQAFSVPCENWVCCELVEEIAGAFDGQYPLPWNVTEKLIRDRKTGKPTEIYRKMGIYR